MSAYVPEFTYGLLPHSYRNGAGPQYGLVPWPAHLRSPESSGIELTKKGEAYAHAAIANAAGVIFLTLDPEDRVTLATTIERLINLLDSLDLDADLEPTLAGWQGATDDLEDVCEDEGAQCDDEGIDDDREPEVDGSDLECSGEGDAPIHGGGSVCQREDGWRPAAGRDRPARYVEHARVLPTGDIAREIIKDRDDAAARRAALRRRHAPGSFGHIPEFAAVRIQRP